MKKNQLIIVGVVAAVVVIGLLVWFFGFKPGRGPGLLGPNIGPMTDELYIEIALDMAKEAEKNPNWTATEENTAEILKKYGVTLEQYNAYSEMLLGDSERYSRVTGEITNRIIKRTMEEIKFK
jgi:hypothetical protein